MIARHRRHRAESENRPRGAFRTLSARGKLSRLLKPTLLLIAISVLTVCDTLVSQETVPPSQIAVTEVPKPARKDDKWGYVNSRGEFVIKPKYFAAEPFCEGFALVVTGKPWQPLGNEYGEFRLAEVTYIDLSGHEIRPPLSVRRARSFESGRALVVPDSALRFHGGCAKGGYLDAKGDWAIKPQFDGLTDFSEGLAAVNMGANCGMGGKWGYIDKEGHTVIPFKFLWAAPFHDGHACVSEKSGEEELIDRIGNIIRGKKCR